MNKPDSSTAAIVQALRKIGASVEYHAGSAGSPDLIVGYHGRMWFVEVKRPGLEHGVCGCTASSSSKCIRPGDGLACICTGHNPDRAGERKVFHRQLAWHEAWQGPPVQIWTSVEQAIEYITEVLALP